MNSDLLALLASPAYLPFAVALAIMLIIALVEAVGALIGIGFSGLLDGLFFGLDAPIDRTDAQSAPAGWRGWLYLGRVPVLVLLVLLLTFYGLSGLLMQGLSQRLLATTFPAQLVSIPALMFAVTAVRLAAGLLVRMMPKDSTEAVESSSFIGRVAVITLGTARMHSPAQAKLTDQFSQTHYVMVEPDNPEEEFSCGTSVLLVKQEAAIFRAIRNTFEPLLHD